MASKSVERLLNVIMTIGSRRRIDRSKLFAVIPAYAEATSDQAAERMFERDKAAILALGLPLITEKDVLDENIVYYRIDSPAGGAVLDLSTAEYTVLLAASRAWDDATAGGAARRVRAKLLSLGHDADPDLLRRTPRGAVESLPVLSPLLEAVVTGRSVRFRYRPATGEPADRHVEPWVVGVHHGHWYLHGFDRERSAPRSFRASRIESFPVLGSAATAERPADLDLGEVLTTMLDSDDRAGARVRLEPYKALALRDRAGAGLEEPEVQLPQMPRPAARRLILAEARWAKLLEPAAWRTEIAQVLSDIRDRHAAAPDLAPLETAEARPAVRIRSTQQSGDHLSRLISTASSVMRRGEVDLEQLAEELSITPAELIKDLEVLFVCGDMGTGWEDFIETEYEHGIVRVRNAEPLRRALRLSAVETTALLAGLAALEPAAGEAEETVASARQKLLDALAAGSDPSDASVAPTAQELAEAAAADESAARTADRAETVLSAVQGALRADEGSEEAHLVIRYSSADRAGTSVRRIRPLAIETDGTRSYLRAYCELAEAERAFRLDRVVEVLDADAPMHRPAGSAGPVLSGRVQDGAWLRLEAPARWIAESFDATELRDGADGVTYAHLPAPVRASLVDAVLEAAGAAEVLTPRDLRDTIVTVARDAAARHDT